jgi:uncharacterized protein with von Willebrand factor type A (vWA) domain
MEKRMIEFIRALRAAGVRISLAESQDALYGTEIIGVHDPNHFKSTLKTTLVKEAKDQSLFEYFYPLFFASNHPPMQNIPDNLNPDEQRMLEKAMRSLAGMSEALKDLLRQMMEGRSFSQDELDQMGQQAGVQNGTDMYQRPWF